MTYRLPRLPMRGALASAALLIAGCAATPPPTPAAPSSPVPQRLAQVGYGQEAVFETCRTDACPQRTPKTLPILASPPAHALAPPTPLQGSSASDRETSGHARAQAGRPQEEAALQQIDIQFAFASARLGPDAHQALRALAPRLAQARQVKVSGRTDSTGPTAVNERLAKARADAVLRELLVLAPGIAPVARVDAQGACCYAQANDSAAGRARNRRVEIRYRLDSDVPPEPRPIPSSLQPASDPHSKPAPIPDSTRP